VDAGLSVEGLIARIIWLIAPITFRRSGWRICRNADNRSASAASMMAGPDAGAQVFSAPISIGSPIMLANSFSFEISGRVSPVSHRYTDE
jgi:hypothetical protein